MFTQTCAHFDALVDVEEPKSRVCDQCVAMGDRWVHLRSCLVCGQVGCCEDSKNTHARKHWQQHGHPLVRSIEPGESWSWCYEDSVLQR